MLHFWKRPGPKRKNEKSRSPLSTPERSPKSQASPSLTNGALTNNKQNQTLEESVNYTLGNLSPHSDDTNGIEIPPFSSRSRLSKNLDEVLSDNGALGYFIQYLDSKNLLPLIKFWLDAENLRTSTKETISKDIKNKTNSLDYTSVDSDCESATKTLNECPQRNLKDVDINSTSECDAMDYPGPSKSDFSEKVCGSINKTRLSEDFSDVESVCSNQTSRTCSSIKDKLIQDDVIKMYNKYMTEDGSYHIDFPQDLRDRISLSLSCDDLDPECFSEAQNYIYKILENNHFGGFLQSNFHLKHQIDVLTSGNVELSDILYNEPSFFYFMEFMEQEGHQSLLEFWLAAHNFQEHLLALKSYDGIEAQNDAMILYDKYFSLQATNSLGFGDKIRFSIEQNICREGGPLPNCFQEPVNIILKVIEKNFLKQFLTSQLYFNFLSELINAIQAIKSSSSRTSDSLSNSEQSISTQNTLLAMESTNSGIRKIVCNVDEKSMNIDSRQLYDPDSLWKRTEHKGLSFGRINALGRFETDMEPEPDRKEGSKFAKVVKKLVNIEEDKTKEEMAWQIAEMIVKDITSVTLSNEENT